MPTQEPPLASAQEVLATLAQLADPERAHHSQRFFRTAPGQYGHGDRFLGITVPVVRRVAARGRALSADELRRLAADQHHEARLTAVIIITEQYRRTRGATGAVLRQQLAALYTELLLAGRINNWDLIDVSAPTVLGGHYAERDRGPLFEWIRSEDLWRRRAALLTTFGFIATGEATTTLELCALVLDDRHDLIHKAAGWMLREVGKRVSEEALCGFLDLHAARMPRTMLRYAIERLSADQRAHYLAR